MTTTTDDPSGRDNVRAQLQTWGETLKAELADRVDQALDELGAKIGGDTAT